MSPLFTTLLLLQQPGPPPAAEGRPCRVVIDSIGHAYREITAPSGDKTSHGGGGVLAHCEGTASTIAADSFAHYSGAGRLDLLGNVQIRDTGLALDARFVQYYLRDERLEAHNNVVAVNRRTGSVLRGPNLRYWRAVPGVRDTVEMYATSRPTVDYYAGDTANAEPYVIVADRMRFKGEDRMWGGGRVTVDRSDFLSRSDSLLLDQAQGFGVLTGGGRPPAPPRVEGRGARASGAVAKSYTLTGARIELGFEDREVRQVTALGDGHATGADWTLTADTIHLRVENRQLEQTLAWGDSTRPHAVSTLYTIQADSMAIDSPGEVLTESRAFGQAFSTGRRDSLTPPAQTDWMAGDTLVARFAQETDSAGVERSRLRQMLARGSARSLTHHPDERDPSAAPAINYSRGRRITVTVARDRIERVVVAGRADGVHLEVPPPGAPADTVPPPLPASPPTP